MQVLLVPSGELRWSHVSPLEELFNLVPFSPSSSHPDKARAKQIRMIFEVGILFLDKSLLKTH